MHDSRHQRVGNLTEEQLDKLPDLPPDAHIVSGVIEGHGATEVASSEARLSARVLHLRRTDSGGIEYQVAILASEPAKVKLVPEPLAPPKTANEEAVEYLMIEKGMSQADAQSAVNRFGHTRVLAARDKELDEQLHSVVFGGVNKEAPKRAALPPEAGTGSDSGSGSQEA